MYNMMDGLQSLLGTGTEYSKKAYSWYIVPTTTFSKGIYTKHYTERGLVYYHLKTREEQENRNWKTGHLVGKLTLHFK
jgi:hypothetical protein